MAGTLARTHDYVLCQAQSHHIGQHVTAAVAHERQRYARNRQQADYHAKVFHDVEQEHGKYTDDDVGSKGIFNLHAQVDQAGEEQHICEHQAAGADQAEAFADDGEYEVGAEDFWYIINLRPWGYDWSDVEENDDLIPYYYYDWYLPMVEDGVTEAPAATVGR